jgi:hypothetical protein
LTRYECVGVSPFYSQRRSKMMLSFDVLNALLDLEQSGVKLMNRNKLALSLKVNYEDLTLWVKLLSYIKPKRS